MELTQYCPDIEGYLAADGVIDHDHPQVRETATRLALDADAAYSYARAAFALRLPGAGRWARVDPRGNKPGIDAQFSLEEERLAWVVREEFNEIDYPVICAAPPEGLLQALKSSRDRSELWRNLPTSL
ncbi:hypothetical protein ACFWRV_33675 [Streptomyces sp. NPDC058576]|uniref:hypothetical protein n=1 Tax=Streptomyces sp. NPDC058576 TaxID=3346547 RepID=UPI0036618630